MMWLWKCDFPNQWKRETELQGGHQSSLFGKNTKFGVILAHFHPFYAVFKSFRSLLCQFAYILCFICATLQLKNSWSYYVTLLTRGPLVTLSKKADKRVEQTRGLCWVNTGGRMRSEVCGWQFGADASDTAWLLCSVVQHAHRTSMIEALTHLCCSW